MSGRSYRPPFPMSPRDNADVPRFMRETSEWVEANKAADAADRRTERVSLEIHLTGLALVIGTMLWVAL